MADPREGRVRVDGATLCYFEWGTRQPGGPSTLLVHATGFHARCWDQCVAHLSGHIVAVDMRGHGRSDKQPPYSWDTFGTDLATLVEVLDLRAIVAAGHSMGGHCVVQAAALLPGRFARLVLVDPVILPPAAYAARADYIGVASAAEHPTAKRRNHWHDATEMFDRFKARMPFAAWQPEALRDYCTWGIVPNPHGAGFVLGCPPQVEASIYMGSAGRNILAAVATITVPVTVLRGHERDGARQGAMDFSASPTWPQLAAQFRQGTDVYLPDHSHFIPMENPKLVADYIAGRAPNAA